MQWRIIYVGQTMNALEKRISDHIRNVKFIQEFGSFKQRAHKSLITYRLAVNGIQHTLVVP